MDENEYVRQGDEPSWLLQGYEDVIFDAVPKYPVPEQCNGEVADGHDDVGKDYSFPHGVLGGLFRSWRDGGLDLQHHIVTCIGKSNVA